MHTVELLEEAIELAQQLGFGIRQEWLGGNGGGACELKGQKWLFIDFSLSYPEQLAQVAEALAATANEASPAQQPLLPMSPGLQRAIHPRKAA